LRDKHGKSAERDDKTKQRGRFSQTGALRAAAGAAKGNGRGKEQRKRHG
jgi:hypothetical protein